MMSDHDHCSSVLSRIRLVKRNIFNTTHENDVFQNYQKVYLKN